MQELFYSKNIPTQTKKRVLSVIINGGFMTAYEKLHQIYGTQEAIAKAFKVERNTVTFWKKNGIPAIRAKQVEKITKGKVTILDVIQG